MGRSQEDVRHLSFWRAVVAEFLGTAFLLAVGCGAWSDSDHRQHAWIVKVTHIINGIVASRYMQKTEAGLKRPPFLGNRIRVLLYIT